MIQQEQLIQTIEHDKFIAGIRSDGIVHVYFKDNIEINISLQNEMVAVYAQLCGEKKFPFIFEVGNHCSITKEAREYAVEIESDKPVLISAVLVDNAFDKLMANFYYKFNKPQKPYKVFRKFDEAISWLLEFSRKNNTL
jgi:hypothetical protein